MPIEVHTYLTLADANDLASKIWGLKAWSTASDASKQAALATASARVDSAMRYQGGKAEPEQAAEFPRRDGANVTTATGWVTSWSNSTQEVTPAVPVDVLRAVLYEADSLLAGTRKAGQDARDAGLVSQTIGSGSETYLKPTEGTMPVLCGDADVLMSKYRLRTGRLL